MNPLDHSLQRLLRAAGRARNEDPPAAPFYLEIKVLARWRSTANGEESVLLPAVFRRAVVCACLLMVVSIGWNWWGTRGDDAGVAALANYEAKLQVLP
jgi:hypothetical protein